MKIVMFEDDRFELLYPLTYLRPVFALRCGAVTLREKVQAMFPDAEVHLEVRQVLTEVCGDMFGPGAVNSSERVAPNDDILLVAGGAILQAPAESYSSRERVGTTGEGEFIWAYVQRETVARLGRPSARELAQAAFKELNAEPVDDVLMRYPWDLIIHNPGQIEADFARCYGPAVKSQLDPGVAVWGPEENLHVAEGAEVQPSAFIDCRHGPVIIERDAVVRAHSTIEGPAFIGRGTHLMEAKIREGTTLGPVCRVGGEVEESILHGYANKYHTGFLGHSYVGEWVNLGALTCNSDLKNDYSSVSVYVQGKPVDTGSMKVGAFIGDHTKTSIGTLLNTGSSIGIMCNLVAGASVLPKYIPSFCWYLESRISKGLGMKAALETARAAMARRGVELTDAMVKLIRYTAELTEDDKMDKVRRDRRKAFGKSRS
jgi:UDP-N-acetylglucosamine diphosphorylase/glucosamine-1-phosphate N-acetyltransferase